MKLLKARRVWACASVIAGGLVSKLLLDIQNDQLSAIIAGAALAAALLVSLRWLRLPLLSPPLLYLSVFALFHLGMAVPWALGLYRDPPPFWFESNTLTPALALVELATASYLAGMLCIRPRQGESVLQPTYSNHFLFASGLALYAAGWAMFVLGIRSFGLQQFFDAGYAGTYRLAAQSDPRLFGTSFTITPIGLYLAAASFPRGRRAVVAAITAAWVGVLFFLGYRGYALIPGLVVIAVLRSRGYRMPCWAGAVLLVTVLVAIPLARAVRDHGLRQRSYAGLWQKLRLLDGVAEMGGSLRPLVHTLQYMRIEPYRYGTTYWRSLGAIWPNLAVHWEGSRYIPLEDLPPNHWLTSQAEPSMYRQHGGLGFSAVAEPYMNFGAPGVVAYFLGLGAGLAWIGRCSWQRPAQLAVWAMVLGPLLWTTRNSFEIFFRPAVWGLLAVWAARMAQSVLPPPQPVTARPHALATGH